MIYEIQNYFAYESDAKTPSDIVDGNGYFRYTTMPLQSNFLVYDARNQILKHIDLDVSNNETWNGYEIIKQDVEVEPETYSTASYYESSTTYANNFYYDPDIMISTALAYDGLTEEEILIEFTKNIDLSYKDPSLAKYDIKQMFWGIKSFADLRVYYDKLSEEEVATESDKKIYAPVLRNFNIPNYKGDVM